MSTDNQNNNTNTTSSNNANTSNTADMNPRRRGSVTQQALAGLFRSNSTSVGNNSFQNNDANRRRLSVSTTGIGLASTSPTNTSVLNTFRRGSISTNSESIDENAIDEEEYSRTAPTTPFVRRMSFGTQQALRNSRNGGGSPGSNGNSTSAPSSNAPSAAARRSSVVPKAGAPTGADPTTPDDCHMKSTSTTSPKSAAALASARRRSSVAAQASSLHKQRALSNSFASRPDQGFNWSEQLRSRAESTVQGPRPSFAFGSSNVSSSPPRGNAAIHDRAKSVSDMPAPPAQAATAQAKAPEPQRQKPDAFQERILKGDFYMD